MILPTGAPAFLPTGAPKGVHESHSCPDRTAFEILRKIMDESNLGSKGVWGSFLNENFQKRRMP